MIYMNYWKNITQIHIIPKSMQYKGLILLDFFQSGYMAPILLNKREKSIIHCNDITQRALNVSCRCFFVKMGFANGDMK